MTDEPPVTAPTDDFIVEQVPIDRLTPHPRNYRTHPEDQLEHLKESLRTNGAYRNVVVANDYTILAGHGVVEAARELGYRTFPVRKLPVGPNSARALKVLIGDNEISHLVEPDDRLLSELLKEVQEHDLSGLLGTGYDEMMLANLLIVTRPASEITDFDEAAEWVGMPEYEPKPDEIKLTVHFRSEEDRQEFARRLDVELPEKAASIWWPPRAPEDTRSIRFDEVTA